MSCKCLMLTAWCLSGLLFAAEASGHPLHVTRAELSIDEGGGFALTLKTDVAALILRTAQGHIPDELRETFHARDDDDIEFDYKLIRQRLGAATAVRFNNKDVQTVEPTFPTIAELRDSLATQLSPRHLVTFAGRVPDGARFVSMQPPAELRLVQLNVVIGGEVVATQLLRDGQVSWPIALGASPPAGEVEEPAKQVASSETTTENSAADSSAGAAEPAPPTIPEMKWTYVAADYLVLGFEHILPKGLDHILFVLGLFLLSPKLKPLLWQVTAFTVAHSVTLALSIYNVVSLPGHIVEPLIALSIVLIAAENVFSKQLKPWRPIVVFAFGLLHGLGFAGVLTELGLPREQFVTALVSFNVGVEVGQLAVIALAFLAVGWFRKRNWYRPTVVVPASLLIACVGAYWTIERVWG